ELFRFLAGPEQSATWHIGTGYVPIVQAAAETRSVQDLVAENPNYQVALDQQENARTADYTNWDQGSSTEIGAAMGRVFGDAHDGQSVCGHLSADLHESRGDHCEQYYAVQFEGWN